MKMSATAVVARTKRLPKANILLIDDDLGFLMYLGWILDRAGYRPWPAQQPQGAVDLTRKLGIKVDLVIASAGSEIRSFLPKLTVGRPPPKFIAIQEPFVTQEFNPSASHAEAVIRKSPADEPIPIETWLDTVRRVLQKGALGRYRVPTGHSPKDSFF